MKLIAFSFAILFFAGKSFSQTPTYSITSKDYYLQESKRQNKIGLIVLCTGLGIAAAGGIVYIIHENNKDGVFDFDFTGAYIAGAGGVVSLASIPFFIMSSNNKKRAASVTLNNSPILLLQQNGLASKMQPTITLKIGL
jgi:hypothetical protein